MIRNIKTKNNLLFTIIILILGVFLGVLWHWLRLFPFPQLTVWRGNINIRQSFTDEKKNALKKLRSLGYLAGSEPAPEEKNVSIYDKDRAFNGFNLITSRHAQEATLIDMEGNILHKWTFDMFQAWPDYQLSGGETMVKQDRLHHEYWRKVHLMENGDIFAIYGGNVGLVKLDKNSNLIWGFRGVHHDLSVASNGLIYVLTREAHIKHKYSPDPILEDFVCILNQDGHLLNKISIMEAIENSPFRPHMKRLKKKGDITHNNTIELLEDDAPYKSAAFKKGRVLLSMTQLNLVCVMDIEKKSMVWGESDLWREQHHPTMLENGNMLVFDNLGGIGFSSRVIELDPLSREIHWQYGDVKGEHFFSYTCGLCQRLPNGNTLITASNKGEAFEVTPDKTIVWKFLNPYRAGKDNEFIATLFEVIRFKPDFTKGWLQNNISRVKEKNSSETRSR